MPDAVLHSLPLPGGGLFPQRGCAPGPHGTAGRMGFSLLGLLLFCALCPEKQAFWERDMMSHVFIRLQVNTANSNL